MKPRVLCVAMLVSGVWAFGQAASLNFSSHHMPGNIMIGGDLGFNVSSDLSGASSVGFYPFAEVVTNKVRILDLLSLDFGGAAVGRLGLGADTGIGLGAMGTIHMGFRGSAGIGEGFFDKLDLSQGFGLKIDLGAGVAGLGLGFVSTSAVNYYVTDHIAVRAIGRYWGTGYDASIGAFFEIGKKEEITGGVGFINPVEKVTQEAVLLQFQLLNSQLFALGGYYFNDRAYEPGVGVRWVFTVDDHGEITESSLWKALMAQRDDGTQVWDMVLESDTRMEYRVTVDPRGEIVELKYDDGEVSETFVPSRRVLFYNASAREIDSEEYARLSVGREAVSVRAGRFVADHLVEVDDGVRYDWWVDPGTPGHLIKFEWKDDGQVGRGEMVEIDRNYH